MSSDINKEIEQETMSSGGLCFIAKPVKPKDLSTIWKYAIKSKKICKSVSIDGHDGDGDGDDNDNALVSSSSNDGGVVSDGSSADKRRGSSRKPYSASTLDGEEDKDHDGSGEDKRKRKATGNFDYDGGDGVGDNDDGDDSRPSAPKKAKVVWTNSLHNLFLQAIRHIGLDKAVPKKILEFMSVPGLTRENIASHLQKYRIFLKKVAERGAVQSGLMTNRGMSSNFSYGHLNSPLPYYSHNVPYRTSLSHRRPYNSELDLCLSQSRLLMNNSSNNNVGRKTPNPSLYSNLNHSYYDRNRVGSTSLLPNRGNFPFYEAASTTQTPTFRPQNEERRGLFRPGMNPGRFGQTSQIHGIGSQYGTSNGSGLNPNPTPNPRSYNGTVYAGFRMNDRGDLIGPGPLQGIGNVNANDNSLGRGIGYMNRNVNNNLNGYGSSSTHHLHQGFGHLSAHQHASSSSSTAPLFSQVQPFLSNGVIENMGQSQGNVAAQLEQAHFVFPEFDNLGKLSCGPQLGGEHCLAEFPHDARNLQNQTQVEPSFQNLEPVESPFGMDNLRDAITFEDTNGWTTSQAGFNGETLNSAAAAAADTSASALIACSPMPDNDPNQEQGAGDLPELLYFNQEDWNDDDFMDSLLNYGAH